MEAGRAVRKFLQKAGGEVLMASTRVRGWRLEESLGFCIYGQGRVREIAKCKI